jgi:hypothetical protein
VVKQKTSRWGARSYTVPNVNGDGEVQYPSVTTILSIINKPALVYWAAKVEREFCLERLRELYDSLKQYSSGTKPESFPSTPSFLAAYLARLGSQLAHKSLSKSATDIGTMVHDRIEWEMRMELGVKGLTEPFIPEELILPTGETLIHPARQSYESYLRWKTEKRVTPLKVEQVVWSHKHGVAGTLDWVGLVEDRITLADWKTSKGIYPEYRYQIAAYRQCWLEMGHGDPPLHAMVLRLPKEEGDDFEVHDVPWEEQDYLMGKVRAAKALWMANQAWEAKKGPECLHKDVSINETGHVKIVAPILKNTLPTN